MFIGRKDELDFLEEKYRSSKAEFIVLYGRRRIGKTALIREFIQNKSHVFYSAVQTADSIQLAKMSSQVVKHYKKDIYSDSFSDWEALFRFISDQGDQSDKLVLVMDEFPYMVQGNGGIPSILQKHWDLSLSDLNIMIIISGSSMGFMEKEVLSEKNPLYGRSTGIMKIGELSFESARGFMGNGTLEDHLKYYSVFSGVPYYLSLIDPKDSFENNVRKNILSSSSVLFNEAEFLLKQELREVNKYNAVIESIALGDTKINGIHQKTGIEKTNLPFYLGNLIDLGIVRKEFPSTIKVKEQAKSRSGIYRLDNSYFRFFYAYVYTHMSELLEGNVDVILEDVVLDSLSEFVSFEFEKVAIEKIRALGRQRAMPIRPVRIGRWWNKGDEIDIVAFDAKDNYVYGECKWRKEKVGIKVLEQLMLKIPKIDAKVNNSFYALFSKSGFTDQLVDHAASRDDVMLLDYSGDEPKVLYGGCTSQ